MILKHFWKVL